MKTKSFISSAICLILLTVASCKDASEEMNFDPSWDESTYLTQDVLYPKNARLKRVILSPNSWGNVYEYDAEGRIYKILYGPQEEYSNYDLYAYDSKGLLANISKYYNDILETETVFSYDSQGNKIKEETKNVENGTEMQGNPRTVTYSYDNGKLVLSEEYFQYGNGEISHYFIKYEYNDRDELIMEKLYVDDENDYSATEHFYHDGLLFYSITYYKNKESGFMTDSRKIYDLNGNLVKKVDNMPGLSSAIWSDGKQPAFYITTEYEYF
ncbi:MAG: hypothetical protein LBE91_03270 [Tannerella sp.]|nr:hypothetical protein [Tannerella sp.]